MSLEESLDTILGDPHTDKGNQNGIIKWPSMVVSEDQHGANWIKIKETSGMAGHISCPQWVKKSARKVFIPHGSEDRATRSRNLT